MRQPCDAALPPTNPLHFPQKYNTTIKIPTLEQPTPHTTKPTNTLKLQPPKTQTTPNPHKTLLKPKKTNRV